jgi:hypothetical protein
MLQRPELLMSAHRTRDHVHALPFAARSIVVRAFRRRNTAFAFESIELHCQLADLALESGNLDFGVQVDDRRSWHLRQYFLIKRRQPSLNQIRGEAVFVLSFPATERSGADFLAELKLERLCMPTIRASCGHFSSWLRARV